MLSKTYAAFKAAGAPDGIAREASAKRSRGESSLKEPQSSRSAGSQWTLLAIAGCGYDCGATLGALSDASKPISQWTQ